MFTMDAVGNNDDRAATHAKDDVKRNQDALDKFTFENKVDAVVSNNIFLRVCEEVAWADLPRVTPSPNIHEHEQDYDDSDVRGKEHIADPKKNPSLAT